MTRHTLCIAILGLCGLACSSNGGPSTTSGAATTGTSGTSSGTSGSSSGATATGSTTSGNASGGSSGLVTITVPALSFGVVGDTRPRSTCKSVPCNSYPTAVIEAIFSDLLAFSPRVGFVLATGDYQYNEPGAGTAAAQIGTYYGATQIFSDGGGRVYPTMGNHECTGATDSNCGPNGTDGVTENYTAFLSDLLGPLSLPNSVPYYTVLANIAGGLTAKFVMIAPNAFDADQQSWLATTLASTTTTYTFLVQHEANNLDQVTQSFPASLSTIRNVVQASGSPASGETYPVTLWLVGHTHNYDYDSAHQQVINGLGGAPTDQLETGETSSTFYGSSNAYMVCAQQASGSPPAIQCNLYDSATNAAAGQAFAVNADGTTATVE